MIVNGKSGRPTRRPYPRNLTEPDSQDTTYEAYRARGVMKNGRRMGAPPKPYGPLATATGKVNVTDPDSRNVKTPRGFMQGYNVQGAVSEQQIVIATEITIDSPHFGHLDPMVLAVEAELIGAGVTEAAEEVVVADPGYWHQVQMQAIVKRGIQVLVPPDAGKRKTPRPGWEAARTRSCAACWPPTTAARSTPSAKA
ncbi:MAG: hypothetical protein LC777_07145 [Actinobacteria bacterium]|nr:hypothetical protein [Actinomycetota bacterium]